jgi:hypothetical protein
VKIKRRLAPLADRVANRLSVIPDRPRPFTQWCADRAVDVLFTLNGVRLIIIGAVMLVVWVGVHRHDKYGCPTCTPDRYLRRHRVSQCETDRRRTQ